MRFLVITARPSPKDFNQKRFVEDTENLYEYLTKRLWIEPDSITLLPFDRRIAGNAVDFQERLSEFILEDPEGDLCIIYIGHGQRNGWALAGFKKREALTYRDLRLSLAHHYGNLILLNGACYGGMAYHAFKGHGGNHLLISAMSPTRSGCCVYFFQNLVNCWEKGEIYYPEKFGAENPGSLPFIWGDNSLQRLMFLVDNLTRTAKSDE